MFTDNSVYTFDFLLKLRLKKFKKCNFVYTTLQMTLRIQVVPPFVSALQVTCKPGHDGVVPKYSLIVVGHEVVFSFYLDEFYCLAQNFQSIEKLDTFANGYVSIYSAVEQKQGGVNLVGIEERALLGKKVGVLPWVAVCSSNGVVAITPIAFAQ